MNEYITYIKNTFKNNDDLVCNNIKIDKHKQINIVYFESLTDSQNIYNFVLKNLYINIEKIKNRKQIKNYLVSPKLKELKDYSETIYYLENGFCIIEFKNQLFASETKASLDRGVTDSQTEPNMYGPKDSFCENYQVNLGLIKRRVKNKNLKIDKIEDGSYTKTKISLLYIDDKVDKNTINKYKRILKSSKNNEVIDSEDLVYKFDKNKVFPTIFKTEKPGLVSRFLLQGYTVILIDNTPFVMILDSKLNDFINPATTDRFLKILRIICFIITIITPAVYIAISTFNQETIPSSLLESFSEQRSMVPFPAIIEAFIMLFICEILREADIRFPSNYGSSASILGALILGDAAVSAGIVSPIMIIIIATTFITSLLFTEIRLVWSIRIMRITVLIFSSILGLYGLALGIILFLGLLTNVELNERYYL